MVDAGAFQRRQIAADLNAKLDDDGKLQARFVGLLLDSETQFDYGNAHTAKNDRVYLAPSLTWRPSAATSLTLLSEYTSDRSGSGRWTAVRPNGSPTHTMIGDPGYDKQSNEQWSFGYLLEHKLDDVWTLRQNFRQANLKSVYASLNADTLTGNVLTRASTIHHSQVDNTVLDNQAEARFRWGPTQHTLLLGVDWLRMTDREVRFRGSARYSGRNYSNAINTLENPAQTIFDAVLHYSTGRWRYALNVSNLTNKQYTSCLAEPTLTCFWAPERTAILSARYRW